MKRLLLALIAALFLAVPATAAGIWRWDGSAWDSVITPSWWDGSTYRTIGAAWWWDGSTWRPAYSTITVAANSVSGSGSGNSSSGTVTTNTPGTTTGGTPIGTPTYSWTYGSGDPGIVPSSTTAQNPTWSETISGVAPGNTQTNTAFWQVNATDPATGIMSAGVAINVVVSWHNSGSTLSVAASGCTNIQQFVGPGEGDPSCSGSAVASGGTGVYTSYQWTFISGSGITITGGTTASPEFIATSPLSTCGVGCVNSVEGNWTVTVTDSSGAMATSSTALVTLGVEEVND